MSNGQNVLSEEERGHLMNAWKTSEHLAMHFNTLLLGFRLKAIGGIAVGAIVSIGFKIGDLSNRSVISGLLVGLAVIWLLVWLIDFFYYYRLLAGAVDELLRLESRLGNVHLSHLIERRGLGEGQHKGNIESIVPYIAVSIPNCPSWPIWMFYAVPWVILIGLAIYFALIPSTISPSVAGCGS